MKKIIYKLLAVAFLLGICTAISLAATVNTSAASGWQTSNTYRICYAGSGKAGSWIKNSNGTTVSYANDTIRLKANSGNTDVHAEIAVNDTYYPPFPNISDYRGEPLKGINYPYLVITARSNVKNPQMRIYIKSSTQGGYDEKASYAWTGDYNSETFTTTIINLHASEKQSLKDAYWGTLQSIRLDYFNNYDQFKAGDWIEIDSIAFCHDYADAEYIKWERDAVRNKNNRFVIDPNSEYDAKSMARLFVSGTERNHNLAVSATNNAVVLRAQKSCNAHIHNSTDFWICDLHGDKSAHDPMAFFQLPDKVSSEYKYMIMTYMAPMPLSSAYYNNGDYAGENAGTLYQTTGIEGLKPYPARDLTQTFNPVDGALVQIYPSKSDGTTSGSYALTSKIYNPNVWYTSYVHLNKNDLQPNQLTYVRIDPIDAHYATPGYELHISAIVFCKTLEEAEQLLPKATIRYEVLGATEGVELSNKQEQTLLFNGQAEGTTFTINPGYAFFGWYWDEAGLMSVDRTWYTGDINTGAKFVPQLHENQQAWNDPSVFYIKVDYLLHASAASGPGEQYDGVTGDATAVNVLSDRAFTIQYKFENAYADVNFISDKNLPAGTRLILLNPATIGAVYSYTLPAATKRIPLSSFAAMSGGAPPATNAASFILCVDLSAAEGTVAGEYLIQLEDSKCQHTAADVKVTLTGLGSITLTDQTASAPGGTLSAQVQISGLSGVGGGQDVIAVELFGASGDPLNIPAGTGFYLNGAACTPVRIKDNKAFLAGVTNGSYRLELVMNEANMAEAETAYALTISLCEATANPAHPMAEAAADASISTTVARYNRHAIAIESNSRHFAGSMELDVSLIGTVPAGTQLTLDNVQWREGTADTFAPASPSWTVEIATPTVDAATGISTTKVKFTGLDKVPNGIYTVTFHYGDAVYLYAFVVVS